MARLIKFFSLKNPSIAIIFAITVLVILAAVLFLKDEQSSQTNKDLVVHTYEVTGHIQLFFNRLKDVELGARGYRATGDQKYLAPYEDALQDSQDTDVAGDQLQGHHSVKQELGILRRLVSDNPVQVQNLDELSSDVDELVNFWATAIKRQQSQVGAKDDQVDPDFQREDDLLNQVHKLVNIMVAEENRLLKKRTEIVEAAEKETNLLISCGILAFYICIISSIWLYQRTKDRGRIKLLRYTRDLEVSREALAMSNAQKDAVLASTAYMLVTTSVVGTVMLMNGEAQRVLGYTSQEVVGNKTPILWHDPDEIALRAKELSKELKKEVAPGFDVLVEKLKLGFAEEREWSLIRKDGSTLPVILNVTTIRDDTGAVTGYLNTIKDITERKANERLKNEFVSVVSHELRTPLTSIRGSLGLIVGIMSKEIPDKAMNLIEIAHKNSERLILLINDILDIDKISNGQMRFDIKAEPLARALQQAVEANNAYAEKFGVSLKLANIPPDLAIDVDIDRFIQVISNLLSNAAKFSPKGSEVKIFTGVLGNTVRICIKDEGPGLSVDFQKRIFEKFSQADSSATRMKGGTGLGLHISKEIVEHMGGVIGFDTLQGKGTTFWVEFPDSEISSAAPMSEPIVASRFDSNRVLICGDDVDTTAALKTQLGKAGFDTEVAYTIANARNRLASRRYLAMTLDLVVSEKNGFDFIRELRESPATAQLPIVIVSAKSEEGMDTLKGDAFGIIDWMPKPLDEAKLISVLQRIVNHRRDASVRILHVEDDRDLSEMLATALHHKADLINAHSLQEARKRLAEETFSLVILDAGLPDGNGLSLLAEMNNRAGLPIPVLILSASEVSQDIQSKVAAALVKSRMSETRIVEIILSLVKASAPMEMG